MRSQPHFYLFYWQCRVVHRLQKFNANPQHPAKGPFSYSIEVDVDAYRESLRIKEASNQVHLVRSRKTNISEETASPLDAFGAASDQTVKSSRRLTRKASDVRSYPGAFDANTVGDNAWRRKGGAAGARVTDSKKVVARNLAERPGGGYIHELREDILHSLVDSTNPRLKSVCSGGKKIAAWSIKSCEKVRADKYFSPSEFTIAVHMWTHTFLGWSYFRGLYNSRVYAQVERSLVPSHRCPRVFN